jgi:signal transduction histidine kinase
MDSFEADIDDVSRIPAVPTILEMVTRITGMRFAAVARVTRERWIACSVLDQIDLGLKPGDELRIETTICNKIQQSREPVIIDHVEQDPYWSQHRIPRMYGFQSYISVPIILSNGQMFGTLCAIDPKPAHPTSPEVLGTFRLFAELISKHLDARRHLAETEFALDQERGEAELREQFIAMLGHDLRTPMRAITCLLELLLLDPSEENIVQLSKRIRDSAERMNGLIDNMLDLALTRLGGGLELNLNSNALLEPVFRAIVAEQQTIYPSRQITAQINLPAPVTCDPSRIGQVLANLLGNALAYGDRDAPVTVAAALIDSKFIFSVANPGEHIPPKVLERIFQPFFRHSMSRTREGLGLGLYISHQIAHAHGATLNVRSDDVETRFTFSMPLAAAG